MLTKVSYSMIDGAPASVLDFGADSTGSADSTSAIQAALNSGAKTVVIPDGTYKITTYLLVPAGVKFVGQSRSAILRAANNIPLYATWGSAHQYQMVLLNGNDAEASTFTINGNTFICGGVGVYNTQRNRVQDCYIYNNTGGAQGILATASIDLFVRGNFIKWITASSGIQLWQVSKGLCGDNEVRVVGAGGIFLADCDNFDVTGNTVKDCADVGLDIEGGVNCSIHSNTVSNCSNGELSYFANGTGSARIPINCLFQANTVVRSPTYLAGVAETVTATSTTYAGISVYSVTNFQENIVFQGNTVFADTRLALMTNDLGTNLCGVVIKDNVFTSNTTIFNIQRAYSIIVQGNTFKGGNGSEIYQNVFKNCNNGYFSDNDFVYTTTKTTNYALYYFTDVAIAVGPTIIENRFYNCAQYAFLHDPFVGGTSAILVGNQFTSGYGTTVGFEPNAGIEATASGYPLFRGQKLYYQITTSLDFTTVTALASANNVLNGKLLVVGGNVLGASYDFVYSNNGNTLSSRDGSGSGSGIPTSTSRYATFSGSTITITAPATAYGNIEADVTSWL